MKRRGIGLFILVGVGAALAATSVGGCSSSGDEFVFEELPDTDAGGDADARDSSDGDTSCDETKAPSEEGCVIGDDYGVFVSPSGDDQSGQGTQSAPFQTITKGLGVAKANSKRVYVCDDGEGFDERITIDSSLDGLEVFGGFDCETWKYGKTKAQLKPTEAGIAWRFDELAEGFLLQDFDIAALDGQGPGASSIAMLVNASEKVVLRGLKLTAGKGADGTDAVAETEAAASGESGKPGGAAVCTGSANPVGAGGESTCGASGGAGGTGGSAGGNGGSGAKGEPDTATGGKGGDGATASDACSAGSPGADGAAGEAGANASGIGTLTSSGWKGTSGAAGKDGAPGQGGGGGGGARPPTSEVLGGCGLGSNPRGATGGGGGAGGCGGKGGQGGTPGGASIALVSLDSTVTVEASELVAVAGGRGGDGASGQAPGQGAEGKDGGAGVQNSVAACAGGTGGKGGAGGKGGGGLGGHSLGIAFTGEAPKQSKVSFKTGTAGNGGKGAEDATRIDGIAADVQEF